MSKIVLEMKRTEERKSAESINKNVIYAQVDPVVQGSISTAALLAFEAAVKHTPLPFPGRIDFPVGVGPIVVVVVVCVVVVVVAVDVERGGTPVSQFPEQPAPGSGVPSQLQDP